MTDTVMSTVLSMFVGQVDPLPLDPASDERTPGFGRFAHRTECVAATFAPAFGGKLIDHGR